MSLYNIISRINDTLPNYHLPVEVCVVVVVVDVTTGDAVVGISKIVKYYLIAILVQQHIVENKKESKHKILN